MSQARTVPLLSHPVLVFSTVLAVALAIGFMSARPAGAAPADDPADMVRAFGAQVIAVVADPTLSPGQRQTALTDALATGINAGAVGRFVLGKHGRRASEQELAEFEHLFTASIVAAYARHLGKYAGEELDVGAARSLNEREAIVASRVVRPTGPDVSVDWRLLNEAGSWRIVDVVIEGVSMALTLRSEYATVIRASGGQIEGLLVRLRQQVAAADLGTIRVAADSN